jgi:hypothetical protein
VVNTDGQRMLKLSVREKLHRFFLFQKARLDEELGVHYRILLEAIEVSHVDDGKLFFKRGMEPPLRKAPLNWHLASLEPGFGASSGTGILTFVAFAGCFAMAGSGASPDSFDLFSRSFWSS